VNADISTRVAISTDELPWVARDGIEERVFETRDAARTAIVRVPPGGSVMIPGDHALDVLVLAGALRDGGVGTYVHDSASTRLVSDTGCTLFVKQRPVRGSNRVVVAASALSFGPFDARGVAELELHADPNVRIVMMRFAPGAAIARHQHALAEELFVLAGDLRDEHGTYAKHWWVRQPPGSTHAVRSETGCTTLVFVERARRDETEVAAEQLLARGRYRVDAVLSRSEHCTVVAATIPSTTRRVALKILRHGRVRPALVTMLFLEGARGLSLVRSAHVVSLYDFGMLEGGEPYLAMELVDGKPLAPCLAPDLAVEYGLQACAALDAVHAAGFVHRNVQPAHLIASRSADGSALVKLVSFTSIKQMPRDKPAGVTMVARIGSPAYMSPEQIAPSRDVDARSDVWSLGVTLYQLVTGQLPFVARSIDELATKIAEVPHPRLAGAPPALAAVIDRCLAKNRAHRFASAAELGTALSDCRGN